MQSVSADKSEDEGGMFYTRFSTSLCEIILAGDEKGLRQLHMNTGRAGGHFAVPAEWQKNDSFFRDTVHQIQQFLSGIPTVFNVRLALQGSAFQMKVWKELQRIPWGELRSYGDIAAAVGQPGAARAVGMANNRNPIPLIIPCHRVIGKNGNLTGYAPGLDIKGPFSAARC